MSEISLEKNSVFVPIEVISQRIFMIRGQKVMLDMDLAELYCVTTKVLNQSVKRNFNRFPSDFMFQLSIEELKILNRSQFVTGSQKHRNIKYLPYVFSEQGVAMLSSVLKSDRAIQMNILIIRAFIKIREILASNKELSYKIEELEREQKVQNKHINAIYSILGKFLEEPAKPKGPIGFTRE